MYEPERINQIMKEFQEAMVEADNFPKDNESKDYKKFWLSFRKQGAALFGLTNFLLENHVK